MLRPSSPKAAKAGSIVALTILLIALVAGVVLRLRVLDAKPQLTHDEIATYLAATGHQGAYQRAILDDGLANRWVPASEWKAFLEPGDFWVFGTIATDLAHNDNHPPFYFWVLHVWVAVFGVSIASGLYLGMVISALAALCLFGLARRVLRDSLEASLVVLIWSVSPAVIGTSFMARHYDMLALVTIGFVWLLLRATDVQHRLRWYDVAPLALVGAIGMLTHYQFAIVTVGAAIYALAVLARRQRRRLLALMAAAPAAIVLFVAGMPHFRGSLSRQSNQIDTLEHAEVVARIREVKTGMLGFFGPQARPLVIIALLLLAGALALAALRAWPPARGLIRRVPDRRRPLALGMLFFAVWIGGATVALYLTGKSPSYAMHDRYLAAFWPFLAFVPVVASRVVGRLAPLAIVGFCVLVMLPANETWLDVNLRYRVPGAELGAANALVIDDLERSILLRTVWWVPDTAPVYAAWQSALLADPAQWQPPLQAGAVYATAPSKGNTWAGSQQVRGAIAKRLALAPIESQEWRVCRLYGIVAQNGPGPK